MAHPLIRSQVLYPAELPVRDHYARHYELSGFKPIRAQPASVFSPQVQNKLHSACQARAGGVRKISCIKHIENSTYKPR